MADPLEKQVVEELKKGVSKEQIRKKLQTSENLEDLVWYLNAYPDGRKRAKAAWLNWLLVLVLLLLTFKKVYFIALLQMHAMGVGQFTPLLLLELIVPAINFFILSKLVRFQSQGYQFMAVLGLLGLIRADNRAMPDGGMYLVIIGLSIYLLLYLFPKKERLQDKADKK